MKQGKDSPDKTFKSLEEEIAEDIKYRRIFIVYN